jgi:ankyrin repeat protein
VELLLEHGAELEACDDNGQTPLLAAVIDGAEAVVRTLLREGADVNRTDDDGQVRKRSFVHFINAIKMINWPRQARDKHRESTPTKTTVFSQTALMAAASEGEAAIVTLLLEAGADWRPAHRVCAECYPAWLHPLPHGRDGETALSLARRNGTRYTTL